MELNELFDEIKTKVSSYEKRIEQQSALVRSLENDIKGKNQEIAVLQGRIIEAESRWNKIQVILRGAK